MREVMKEIWKDIVGFEGLYRVSNRGRVLSLARVDERGNRRKAKFLRFGSARGYAIVALSKNVCVFHYLVSRLVLMAFIGPQPKNQQAAHNNGNKLDNRLNNLRWCTRKENAKDKNAHGTALLGERNHQATKLCDEKVIALRTRRKAGESLRKLAKEFNIDYRYASRVANNRAWSHVS